MLMQLKISTLVDNILLVTGEDDPRHMSVHIQTKNYVSGLLLNIESQESFSIGKLVLGGPESNQVQEEP